MFFVFSIKMNKLKKSERRSERRSEPVREKILLRNKNKKSSNTSIDDNNEKENKMVHLKPSVSVKEKPKLLRQVKKKSRISGKHQTKNQKGRRRIVVKKNSRKPQPKKRKNQRTVIEDTDQPLEPQAKKRKGPGIQNSDTDQPPAPQAKARKEQKRSSPIWDHFYELILTVDGVESTYAKCKHCPDRKYKVSHKSNRSTGNMRRHLKREHSDLTLKEGGPFIFSQENFRKTLLKWIVLSSQPFSVVEEDAFVELIQTLNPSAEIVSDKTIKFDLTAEYLKKVEEIKEELRTIPGKISITMDMWSSKNVLPFLAIRAHWISSEWEYKTRLLDFAHVVGDHDGKTQCRLFLECISRFEIPLAKVLAFTMDNATPNDTFISCLQERGIELGIDVSVSENQVRCLAHILNLCVQDILKDLRLTPIVNTEEEILDFIEMDEDEELEDEELADDEPEESEQEDEFEYQDSEVVGSIDLALKKLRKLVRKIRKSTKLRQKLKQLCMVYDVKPLVPIIDICTRWNSTYAMIKRAQHLKYPLRALCLEQNDLISLDLPESEWEELKSIEVVLQRFDRATQLISMERHPTITSYIPVMNWLIDVLTTYVHEESGIFAVAANAGLEKLLKYEPAIKSSKLLFIATFLNPSFKLNYFKEQDYTQTDINEIKRVVSQYFVANYERAVVNEHEEEEKGDQITDELVAHMYKRSRKDPVSTEFDRYISFPLSAPKTSDLLKYWKAQEDEFPLLSQMARDFLCIQSTSVPVERDNSAGADIVTPTRCSLIAPTIQATMCLKSWYRAA